MIDLKILEKKLNIIFHNSLLIQQAFIHRSYLNETNKQIESNERLEFLGDSILSFLVSEYLYSTYKHLPEGELTNLRSSIVKTTALSSVAKSLDLGSFLFLSKGEIEGGGRDNPSILADTFEALLGAIYLDQGLKVTNKLLSSFLFPILETVIKEKSYKDSKSKFQEIVQNKTKFSPIYKVIEEKGPDHAKEFTIGVYVNNQLWGWGYGKNKQEAEQLAASNALEKWPEK
ncbi:ribonuclease III [Candidatus Gottesmanbacteria bacterium RIFCSPLOWO2_01_FULL_39_12b]|uniref:Ribonuclease 3 n=1 Tax=Candidatus Gottesmanbacteria bacterium RIFCSPLOWO2_01_FULL_39_12b TaxID=1798388 RepID=A0A1F6AQF8_9BACT|nr:MAG: ribonuclease III [Candidatus Gottesmanbacteria bacterium RIFCSPLOWO2_01_FULL_39_12b]